MKNKGMRVAVSILALTISGLVTAAQAQPKVTMKFKNIGVPGAYSTDAYAINNKNVIVGDYTNAAGLQQAMLLKGAKVTPVSCPSGAAASAFYGINSGGTAVTDDYCGNGIVWTYVPGVGWVPHVPLPDCPDCPFWSLAINDNEVVNGVYQDSQQFAHVFYYEIKSGAFSSVDLPGDQDPGNLRGGPGPRGINNAGMMTLEGTDPASGLVHSFLFNGKSVSQIDVPGALQSFAHGINNNGDIVYTVEDANGNSWGVFFYAALQQFYWFNQPDGRDNTRGYGINDEVKTKAGVSLKIVGDYSLPGSSQNLAYEATVTIN